MFSIVEVIIFAVLSFLWLKDVLILHFQGNTGNGLLLLNYNLLADSLPDSLQDSLPE